MNATFFSSSACVPIGQSEIQIYVAAAMIAFTYLDPGLCWTGCKNTGRGGGLSVIGFHNLTRPKSYHLKKVTA